MKRIIFGIILILILFTGCSDKNTPYVPTTVNGVTQEPADPGFKPEVIEETKTEEDVNSEYRDLEITPSGDEKCFLSPCDCQCYPIPNVPKTAKKPTCAVDCKEIYEVSGCRFTNYQCVVLN